MLHNTHLPHVRDYLLAQQTLVQGTANSIPADTGIRDCQLNDSSENHPARILLMKVSVKVLVIHPGIEPWTSSAAGEHLNH